MSHRAVLKQQTLKAFKSLDAKRVAIPRHLESNIPNRFDRGNGDRWTIYLNDSLQDVLISLCKLKRVEEIAANFIHRFLRTTDHELRDWQRLQDSGEDEERRLAMCAVAADLTHTR